MKKIFLSLLIILILASMVLVLNLVIVNRHISNLASLDTIVKVWDSKIYIPFGYSNESSGELYLWIAYPTPHSIFPVSGPPIGIFNSRGYLVAFTPDSGDDPEFRQKWGDLKAGHATAFKDLSFYIELLRDEEEFEAMEPGDILYSSREDLGHDYWLLHFSQKMPPEWFEGVGHFRDLYYNNQSLAVNPVHYSISPDGSYAVYMGGDPDSNGFLCEVFDRMIGKSYPIDQAFDNYYLYAERSEWNISESSVRLDYHDSDWKEHTYIVIDLSNLEDGNSYDAESTLPIDNDYFTGATNIIFVVSGKVITDQKLIAQILGYLDLINKRRDPCACDGLFAEVTLKDDTRVVIELTPHGWGFKEDRGNIRYLKDPGAFEKLYEKLWEQYGPTSNSGTGQMYLFITPPPAEPNTPPPHWIRGMGRGNELEPQHLFPAKRNWVEK